MIFESVAKNKTKTGFITILFFIFIALFIYFITILFGLESNVALVVATIISMITSLISYYNCDKMVLKLNKARKATREEFLQLNESLEGLCIGAGMPIPDLYIIDDNALNAFATGRNPKHAVVCVTKGLLNTLDKYEMEGVLAHELSHIKNYDILLSTVASIMVGGVVIIADIASRGFIRSNNDDDSKSSSILMLVGIIFILLAPLFSNLLQLALSRNREYLADASAVSITRNKDGLINALKKISGDPNILKSANKTTASMYISNPFKKERDSLFSTHPSTINRIKKLESIR